MGELVPFKPGFLTEPLTPLENVRLKGVRCRTCGALVLGPREHCINCTSTDLEEHIFATRGKIDTFTIIRTPPPPPYPKDQFKPFPAAWVLLDDGLIILSEITNVGLDEVEMGMPVELELTKGWTDENGNDVVMYKFRAMR